MKIILTFLFLIFSTFWIGEDDKNQDLKFSGNTQWIGEEVEEGQYEEEMVYQSIDKPIYVIDEGKKYTVSSFDFVYKELAVYENAEGKPELMCDVSGAKMNGDRIDSVWVNALRDRLAWGDTLIFTDVVYQKKKKQHLARPLKVYMYRPERLRP